MSGDWAKYETVRGKGSTVNCMFCGRKPQILEKGFHDGSHVFSISCPHCWNKHFRDKRETGVDITVCSETVYPGIRDWNKVNGAFDRGYRKALKDVEYQLTDNLYKHVEELFLYGEVCMHERATDQRRKRRWREVNCNYFHGKCLFLNCKEEGCIACPIKRAYNKGVIDTKKDYDRQQGEWTVCGEDLPYSDEYDYQTNFCPNCGAPMNEEAFRKYNGLKEGKAEEKKPCPCNTCQTAIDRCGCQMHLCSEYQKWKGGGEK